MANLLVNGVFPSSSGGGTATAFDLSAGGNGVYSKNISATVGNRTANALAGNAIVASGSSSVVITNSYVTAANSRVLVQRGQTTSANAVELNYVQVVDGSFTVWFRSTVTANQEINWLVLN